MKALGWLFGKVFLVIIVEKWSLIKILILCSSSDKFDVQQAKGEQGEPKQLK